MCDRQSGADAAWREGLERDGFAIIPDLIRPAELADLVVAGLSGRATSRAGVLEREGGVYGIRDLIWRVPAIRRLAQSPVVLGIARAVLGPAAFVVRGLYFDKTLDANWALPWHQDLTIAVKARRDVPGFGPWTLKAGIPHALAPSDVLERMVTVRIHLDPCGPGNGPMRIIPGSHAAGKLDAAGVARWLADAGDSVVECIAPKGGAVVMRPLLLHSSSAARAPGHRRVIHLEYAAAALPVGLEWYDGNSAEPAA